MYVAINIKIIKIFQKFKMIIPFYYSVKISSQECESINISIVVVFHIYNIPMA